LTLAADTRSVRPSAPDFTGTEGREVTTSGFNIDFAFDTNAVRCLARLPEDEWASLLAGCREERLKGGWIPRVIKEVAGSNLMRRNLDDAGLRELVLAAKRYDDLCAGRVLPDPPSLMWVGIHRLAGVEDSVPPGYRGPEDDRLWLDRFLSLSSASQVRVGGETGRTVFIKPHDDVEWGLEIPQGFEETAPMSIDVMRGIIEEKPEITQRELAWEYFKDWAGFVSHKIGIPPEVPRAVSELGNDDLLANTALVGGLFEGWFLAARAMGRASKLSENDARDMAIGSYLAVVAVLVTEDGSFRAVLKSLLLDPARAVRFHEFLADRSRPSDGRGPN